MHLCNIGKVLFEDYQKVRSSFSDDISKTDAYTEREEIIDYFMSIHSRYMDHVLQCLECNIDDREKL